jgi:hypothetical protein
MSKKLYAWRYIIYFLIIAGVSAYLILLTYGYRINWLAFKLQKTSVIYVASIPRDATVYINDKVVSDSTPLRYNYVFPERYDIRIERPDYETWSKTFDVKEDIVSQDPDIILILKNKTEIKITDAEKDTYPKMLISAVTLEKNKAGLSVKNGNEIYFNDVFVTRFSQNITNIAWFPDKKHIIYQVGNSINFMDTDGSNVINLVILPGTEKAEFSPIDDGKYLVYKYKDDIHKIQITNISSLFQEKYFNKAVKIIK